MPESTEEIPTGGIDPYRPPVSAPTPPPALPGVPGSGPYGPFINTLTLSKTVIGLVVASAILEILIALICGLELAVMKSESGDAYLAGASYEWIPIAMSGTALLWFVLFVVTVIAFSKWIIRSSKNAWLFSMGSRAVMSVSPGWAVGYYFIPIVNFWRPYTAMREIRDATEPGILSKVLPLWWTTWILSSIVGQISFRLANNADTVESYISSSIFDLATLPINLALDLLAILLVHDLTRAQLRQANAPAGEPQPA